MSDNTSVPMREIQTALFDVLNGKIEGQVYDEVPATGVAFPYTTFGDVSEGVLEARGVKGRVCYFQLRVHSRGDGGKFKCYDIMTQIVEKVTAGKLELKNWREIWKTYNVGRVVAIEKDPGSYMAVVQFLIAVCKAT